MINRKWQDSKTPTTRDWQRLGHEWHWGVWTESDRVRGQDGHSTEQRAGAGMGVVEGGGLVKGIRTGAVTVIEVYCWRLAGLLQHWHFDTLLRYTRVTGSWVLGNRDFGRKDWGHKNIDWDFRDIGRVLLEWGSRTTERRCWKHWAIGRQEEHWLGLQEHWLGNAETARQKVEKKGPMRGYWKPWATGKWGWDYRTIGRQSWDNWEDSLGNQGVHLVINKGWEV